MGLTCKIFIANWYLLYFYYKMCFRRFTVAIKLLKFHNNIVKILAILNK